MGLESIGCGKRVGYLGSMLTLARLDSFKVSLQGGSRLEVGGMRLKHLGGSCVLGLVSLPIQKVNPSFGLWIWV